MNELCRCAEPGYCDRHKMVKNERLWKCCRGEGGSLDCGQKEWRAWEQGLLGATEPEDSQPFIEWECRRQNLGFPKPGSRLLRPRVQAHNKGRVGSRAKALIKERYKVIPKGGCKCTQNASKMDSMGCDGCEEKFDECVEMLLEGAKSIWYVSPVVWFMGDDKVREEAGELLREAIRLEREVLES